MQIEMRDWNKKYEKAVRSACLELSEMVAPTELWETCAAVVITKHLTPLFRELMDEVKCAKKDFRK